MTDKPRLIEFAFPLKQASLTSVHEKNVRHGHISTLHIWPARRPLAACRAALLATLLPDPGTPEERQKLCDRIGGKVVENVERKKMPNGTIVERVKEEVEDGVLGWIGTEPKSGSRKKKEAHRAQVAHRESELNWFREEIKKAYGGRAPKVLDPFAGGGAIPLEAMRLGCETTAIDINPVAWFILKCTLEYPQKLAGKTHPLPEFILDDEDFMEDFYKAHPHLVGRTKRTMKQQKEAEDDLFESQKQDSGRTPKADLAWHVRAWGRWVLNEARKELAPLYPTYSDFEPLDLDNPNPFEKQEMQLVPLKEDGTTDIEALNAEFSEEYLRDKKNPRWVAKPTVAYLWARTVRCKNCRAIVPLLKTRWLCKKDRKRILLTMKPKADGSGVEFDIQNNVPTKGGNAAQNREHDKRIGDGTMSGSGVQCPCCPSIMTMEDIRVEGKSGQLENLLYCVVVNGQSGKEYRQPTEEEISASISASSIIDFLFSRLPTGLPKDKISPASTRSISCHEYGIDTYTKLMTARQQAFIGSISHQIRIIWATLDSDSTKGLGAAVAAFLLGALDKCLDYGNTLASWYTQNEQISHLFNRYSLPMKWDYAESAPFGGASGSWESMLSSVARSVDTTLSVFPSGSKAPSVIHQSVLDGLEKDSYDLVITDPPYYQAVSYADLSDFFYVWLRCAVSDKLDPFHDSLTPKDKEIVQHIRSDKKKEEEKRKFESWMANAFREIHLALVSEGQLTIVFAHKEPEAWETLVAAIIQAGFTVYSSWPIQTEMPNRSRGYGFSALASSIWLVCKKRPITTRPGWDNKVLEEMRSNITERLHAYWDAGIRGPDFVWAATGPGLEAYSKHPIVKKANAPGEVLGVGEFLTHVRRMVVDFVVGQVLTGQHDGSDMAAADRMDAPTSYYLLHRHDFGLEEAPAGACILYATACGLSDRDLDSVWGLVSHKGTSSSSEDDDTDPDAETDPDESDSSGSKIKLKTWAQRKHRSMGYEAPGGRPIPLIDRIHHLMHLWRAGDVHKVDDYLDDNGLRRQELFKRLVQSLIELSVAGSEERSLLESLSNHIQAKGATMPDTQITIDDEANQ
ncbi:MAG: hypothetical protein CL946_12305 [Ectothiorhodospiraceae bacterium]|nr:hypothetical protein [Ectothiorhodospiraceae bacterium]